MGVSTDAILFYGYVWTEETSRPWTIGREDEGEDVDEDTDDDWAARYAAAQGCLPPAQPFPEGTRARAQRDPTYTPAEQVIVDAYRAYWAQQRALVAESACEVGFHCSDECPMSYVAVRDSEIRAHRGHPKEITSLQVGLAWNAQLAVFCAALGIDVADKTPGWYLVSNWA